MTLAWWFFVVSLASGFYVQGLGWRGPFETREDCERGRRQVETDLVRTHRCEHRPDPNDVPRIVSDLWLGGVGV